MNIAEILKNAPIGLELYSPYCGLCNFYGIDNEGKIITEFITFSSEGKINDSGECLLFPSKEHKDWVGWQKYLFHQGDIIDDGKGIFIICKSSICCVDSSNNIRFVDFNESNYANEGERAKFLEEVKSNGYKFDYSSGGLISIKNENEKVREEIIDFIYDKTDTEELREKSNRWLEWLEKQKEATCVSEIIDRLTSKEQEILFKELEMQKPTNKVEPKFKQRDWIVFNGLTLYVKEVVEGFYRTISKGGITNSYDWDIDNIARFWTIQDARPGDILSSSQHNLLFIYKDKDKYYICVNLNYESNSLIVDGSICIPSDTTPATTDQCKLLLKKIEEVGYEWDAEKKELIKIEQKYIPKHKVGETIYYNSFGELKSMIVANVTTDNIDNPMYKDENGSSVFEKDLIKQSPTWSEEDRIMLSRLEFIFTEISKGSNSFYGNKVQPIIDWLKSLKNRVPSQPKQEWSEEDKRLFGSLRSTIELDIQRDSDIREMHQEELEWLDNLYNRDLYMSD